MASPSSATDERRRGELFELHDWLADHIAGRFPPILQFQADFTTGTRPFVAAVTSGSDLDDPQQLARSRIVNQATNDFLDLFYEAMSGRGRPAVRSARTLFEHLVNLRWTTASGAEAERYCEHAAIGELLDLDLNTPTEDQFTGHDRKRVRHARKKLERRVRPAARAAIKKYGSGFQRSWTQASLRDRATAVGLAGDYDGYRLMSAMIHGSAGGDLGQRREIDGHQVVRTGPAVDMCPYALQTGLRHFRLIVDEVRAAVGPGACQPVDDALSLLTPDALEVHEAACVQVDHELWPETPPAAVMFLRVELDGSWTWLLLDGERPETIEAVPVNLDSDWESFVRNEVAAIEAANPGRTKPIVMGVERLRGTPKPGASWKPAADNLRQPQPGEGPFRALPVKEAQWDPSLHG